MSPFRPTGQFISWVAVVLLPLCSTRGWAQEPALPRSDLVTRAAQRYPQVVRVGDLIDRRVLRPTESRIVLGHVTGVIRLPGGSVQIVMRRGGFLGIGSRAIGVPVEGMALLGAELEVLDFTAEQLDGLPAFDGTGAQSLSADESIRMGLARPSH